MNRIKFLEKQIYAINEKIALVDEKYEFIDTFNKKLDFISDSVEGSIGDSTINDSDVEIEVEQYKKCIRVDISQVDFIGYELKLGFIAKGVSMELVEKHLFPEPIAENRLYQGPEKQKFSSIIEIQAILSQYLV